MAFKMKGSHHYGKNPLKQVHNHPGRKGAHNTMEEHDPPLHQGIKDKAAKNDWEAGSTLQEGDYATYDQQAYDVKGNKRDFNAHEVTGPVIFNQHGRPYSEEEGTDKVVFWSGKSSSGTPASPAKHGLPGGEDHTHGTNKNASFDTDTEEKDFTRRDKRTYVRTKKDKKKVRKSDNYDMIRGNVINKKPKKKKDTWYRDSDNDGTAASRGLKKAGKWAKKNIDLKGAFFWEGGGAPRKKSSSAFWHKENK